MELPTRKTAETGVAVRGQRWCVRRERHGAAVAELSPSPFLPAFSDRGGVGRSRAGSAHEPASAGVESETWQSECGSSAFGRR